MRITTTLLLAALVALAVLAPAAGAADLPEAIEDPVEAIAPEEPAPTPTPTPQPQVDPGPAADDDGTVQGIADATVEDGEATVQATGTPAGPGPATATTTATVGSGQLPFTGSDSSHLLLMLLVGSVVLLGGFVTTLWAASLDARR